MTLKSKFLLYTFIGVFFKIASGQTLQNVKNLHNILLKDYNKNIVPISNHSTPIEIGISFYLLSINEFKEVEETLLINGGMGINWNDVSLSWDPTNYGGKQFLPVDSTDVWKPLLYLINSATKLEPIGSDSSFPILIYSNGSMQYWPAGIIEAKCKTDISNFPLDTQTCSLTFIAWLFGTETYRLSSTATTVYIDFFTKSSNWELLNTSTYAKLDDGYYSYEVNLALKRKAMYYIVMVIIPTLMLTLLNPLVFLLPVESGERVSLAMTMLLSYAIFLTLVAASIPATSNPMCLLLVIMIMIMMLSGMTVVAVIISASYYYGSPSYTPGKFIQILIKLNHKELGSESEKLGTSFSGQDASRALDRFFVVISYVLILLTVIVFCVYTSV